MAIALETALSVSTVEFRNLDDAEIRAYVASGEPLDKAGAYAIQGRAAVFVRTTRRQLFRHHGPAADRDRGIIMAFRHRIRTGARVTEEILINVTPQETRVAVIEQGVVQEVQVERASARGLVGNICMGRVVRVLPGMQSAFIDIGGARAAFLHVADIWGHREDGADAKPIETLLAEGQNLHGAGGQGPDRHQGRAAVHPDQHRRAPARLSAAGVAHRHFAAHRETRTEREHLREKLQQLLPPEFTGGFIVRTMAETASDRELAADVEYLRKLWKDIQDKAQVGRAGRAALPGSRT